MGRVKGESAFEGWAGFGWDKKSNGNLVFSGCNRLGIPVLIADVRFRKSNPAGSQWEAELSLPSGKVVASKAGPSAFAGQVFVESIARSHGADIPESIAGWLVRMREMYGYSMNSLAAAAGIDYSTVRAIEVGGSLPKDETLERLRNVFNQHEGVNVDQGDDRIAALEARVANLERLIGGRA